MPLLYFHGGGYSGCFWEPNLMIFDRTPEGIKPMNKQPCVTGYKGDAMIAASKRSLLQATREADILGEGKWLKTEDDWRWFCKNIGAGYVRRFATCVLEAYPQGRENSSSYYIPCESCGGVCHPQEAYHWSYRGNGGIGINWEGLLCDECLREKHREYVADEWKTMSEHYKKEAWEKSMADNPEYTPPWEEVRDSDELLLDAEHVDELEYY